MANENDNKRILDEIKTVWMAEGLSASMADNSFKELLNDPAVRLLVGSVIHQSDLLSDEIKSFKTELINSLSEFCSPHSIAQPVPSVGIIQTSKRLKRGLSDMDVTIVDDKTVFTVTPDANTKKERFSFVPIIETTIVPVEVQYVEKLGDYRWRISLKENETIESLAGLSIYIPKSVSADNCSIYSDGKAVNSANIYDLDRLPFTKSFLHGQPFSKNAMQYETIQTIHDRFCANASNYIIVLNDKSSRIINRQNGNIIIDLAFEKVTSSFDLDKEDILINCVPVINAIPNTCTLSKQHPIENLILKDESFLTIQPNDDFPDIHKQVSVRTVGTLRMSHQLWMKRMVSLLDHYNADNILLKDTLGKKLDSLTQQFLPMLREKSMTDNSWGDVLCLCLNDPSVDSINIQWLSTNGAKANGLDSSAVVNTTNPALDDNDNKDSCSKTHLVTVTTGGSDANNDIESKRALSKSYLVSKNRIITKSDLAIFCRQTLQNFIFLSKDDILEIRADNRVIKNENGLNERALQLYIFVKPGCLDVSTSEQLLMRMVKTRTISTTPILISIIEYEQ